MNQTRASIVACPCRIKDTRLHGERDFDSDSYSDKWWSEHMCKLWSDPVHADTEQHTGTRSCCIYWTNGGLPFSSIWSHIVSIDEGTWGQVEVSWGQTRLGEGKWGQAKATEPKWRQIRQDDVKWGQARSGHGKCRLGESKLGQVKVNAGEGNWYKVI